MSVTIQTGAPFVANAESFIDSAYLTSYFTKRGHTLPDDIDIALIESYDFISRLSWCKPHNVAFVVTEDMKIAQCEVVASLLKDNPFKKVVLAGNIKSFREKLAVIEEETHYFEGKSEKVTFESVLESMPKVKAILGKLLCISGRQTRLVK